MTVAYHEVHPVDLGMKDNINCPKVGKWIVEMFSPLFWAQHYHADRLDVTISVHSSMVWPLGLCTYTGHCNVGRLHSVLILKLDVDEMLLVQAVFHAYYMTLGLHDKHWKCCA